MRTVLASLVVFLAVTLFSVPSDAADATPVEAKVDKALAKRDDTQRFWVTPEFLMMWSKDGPVNGLYVLRTTPALGLPLLDNPNAERLFDSEDQDYGLQLGGRLTFGMWVDEARKWGFELSGFALQEKEASWTYAGSGNTWAAVSLFDTSVTPPVENGWVINSPGTTGVCRIGSHSQLWGVEGSGLYNFRRGDNMSLDFSFGVKHLDLSEDCQLERRYEIAAGLYSASEDKWEAHNAFYGAKLGLKFNMTCWDRLLLNIEPAVSLGANCESLEISGLSQSDFGAGPTTLPGGGFTAATNLGDYDETHFAVVPEVKVGLGCRITKNISFNASYNFLYVSNVVRPGEQFERRVNAFNTAAFGAPNPPLAPFDPRPRFEPSDYWAHGVGLNLKIKF